MVKRSELPRGADDSAADPPEALIDPVLRWAVARDSAPIKFVESANEGPVVLPYVGDVITHPRFVDPATDLPLPVRVLVIHRSWNGQRHSVAVVVTRDSPQ